MRSIGAMLLASATALGFLISADVHSAIASDADARAAIARLLEVGWGTTPQARQAADAQYQQVAALAPGDPRALTAARLVLMQQRRYDEALKRIDEHLAKAPDDIEALQARAWTLAVLKNYPAALLAADKLSEIVETLPAETDADRGQRVDLVAFLGRLLGYLAGPVADAVNQDQRKAVERQIVARLDETHKTLFEDARDGVLQKFIEMTDASAEERERLLKSVAAEKERTLEELAAEREQLAARERELDDRKNKLRAELRDEIAELQKEDQPLVQELARLEARANLLGRDLGSYIFEIDRLRQLAAAEQNQALKQQYLLDADRLAIFATRIESDLIGVRRLARGVQTQRAALANRQARATANAATQVKRIDDELADLAKRERRSEAIEKRTNRQGPGTTSRARALSATATALSTYDQLPLETARARLLESLR